MDRMIIEGLLKHTGDELFHYHEKHGKDKLKYLIKRIIRPKHTPQADPFFWPQALLTQALEKAGEDELLKKYYDSWHKAGLPVTQIDHVMNGYSLVYLYQKTGDIRYKKMMDKLYAFICDFYKEYGNNLPYRRNHPSHVYVDGLGMVVPFLCRYGNIFSVKDAVSLGQHLLLEFLEKGMDEETGLPYHGYDLKTGTKYGIIGWGRAVGWLLLAMADSLEFMGTGEIKERIVSSYQKLSCNSFYYFNRNGYFTWQLSAKEGPIDTSATAMIAYAIAKGEKTSYLHFHCEIDEIMGKTILKEGLSIEEILNKMEVALRISYEGGKIKDCSGECEGFSQYPQVYGSYPWSNGPTLRFILEKNQ